MNVQLLSLFLMTVAQALRHPQFADKTGDVVSLLSTGLRLVALGNKGMAALKELTQAVKDLAAVGATVEPPKDLLDGLSARSDAAHAILQGFGDEQLKKTEPQEPPATESTPSVQE